MNYNLPELEEICTQPIEWFKQFGSVQGTADGILIHQDNKSKVLAVAHLDTVSTENHFAVGKRKDDRIVFSPTLDDRLGAWVILKLLPSMGIKTDILLTEGEEKGKSTAAYFKTDKQYNWIFSFDRRGWDTVLYRYRTRKFAKLLKRCGFEVAEGMFSDICKLEHLKAKGMNFGVGYYDNHSIGAYCLESHTAYNVELFAKFYTDYQNVYLEHVPVVEQYSVGFSLDDRFYGNHGGFHSDGRRFGRAQYELCSRCKKWLYVSGGMWIGGDLKTYICAQCLRKDSELQDEDDIPVSDSPVGTELAVHTQGINADECETCGKVLRSEKEYMIGKCYQHMTIQEMQE